MKSIAIVGAGSSGLITLKYVLDAFPNAQIVCFEKGSSVRGAWGNMGDSFVSTSSKYATQFRCFQQYDAQLDPHNQYGEYYRGDEFGRYLDRFADEFSLRKYISFETELVHLTLTHQTWCLTLRRDGRETVAEFDGVFLCTGLVRKRREIAIDDGGPAIRYDVDAIQNQRVMIVGGGESAVDMANQLAEESRNNTVYLSLRSGV
ncbi:MAG: FAD/NAD(P)-binding protein, partial [Bdellovibrionales bacterium]|nr:FAD/NAD(P)-binding protein [Bdellovibrionales bacterium]